MARLKKADFEAEISAKEEAIRIKVEKERLTISEMETTLADLICQAKAIAEQLRSAANIGEKAQLEYAYGRVDDEIEGAKIVLTESRAALHGLLQQADNLKAQRQVIPEVGSAVARLSAAQVDLVAAADELLLAIGRAEVAGARVAIQGLLPGGGAALAKSRLDLLPREILLFDMDESGQITCDRVGSMDARIKDWGRRKILPPQPIASEENASDDETPVID